jgi:hypothetical protein
LKLENKIKLNKIKSWFCLALVGFGWLWLALIGFGWLTTAQLAH